MANFSVLQHPNSKIALQQVDNVKYRVSKYTIITKTNYNNEQYACIYNTINDACIIYKTFTPEVKEYAITNWFLVPEDFNEYEFAKGLKESRKANRKAIKENIKNFTIITTTDCNANCYYCFEAGVKKHSMTPKVAEDVAEFIIKESNGQPVKLNWFGGEPLFNQLAIDTITSILYNEEISYTSTIISNGYLFNELFLERYKQLWNLKRVQITLDGINEYYNAIKDYIYKDDINPFETVISNIKMLIDYGIRVNIRLNVTLDNTQELKDTIDYIYDVFGKTRKLNIYAHAVFQLERECPEQIHPLTEEIHKYIINKFGCKKKLKPLIKRSFCMADNESSCTITSTGKVGLCEHYVDDELIGDIYNGIQNIDTIKKFNEPAEFNYCEHCKFYPSCNLLKHCGDISECNEHKIHEKIFILNQLLFKRLKQYIKHNNILHGNK